jgi:hypothetical protein
LGGCGSSLHYCLYDYVNLFFTFFLWGAAPGGGEAEEKRAVLGTHEGFGVMLGSTVILVYMIAVHCTRLASRTGCATCENFEIRELNSTALMSLWVNVFDLLLFLLR